MTGCMSHGKIDKIDGGTVLTVPLLAFIGGESFPLDSTVEKAVLFFRNT
jgi:hypothetical protein